MGYLALKKIQNFLAIKRKEDRDDIIQAVENHAIAQFVLCYTKTWKKTERLI